MGRPGIVTRDLLTGKIESHAADAVVLATGGYGNAFYWSTNAKVPMLRPSGGRIKEALILPIPALPDPSYVYTFAWRLSIETDLDE